MDAIKYWVPISQTVELLFKIVGVPITFKLFNFLSNFNSPVRFIPDIHVVLVVNIRGGGCSGFCRVCSDDSLSSSCRQLDTAAAAGAAAVTLP